MFVWFCLREYTLNLNSFWSRFFFLGCEPKWSIANIFHLFSCYIERVHNIARWEWCHFLDVHKNMKDKAKSFSHTHTQKVSKNRWKSYGWWLRDDVNISIIDLDIELEELLLTEWNRLYTLMVGFLTHYNGNKVLVKIQL